MVDNPNQKLQWVCLLLTYRCTSECSHCFTSSSTRKDDPMKLSEAQEYLEEAKRVGARRVWLFGGEPFFYFDLLLSIIESAKQLGLEVTTTSNAFWATSEESAVRRLCPLEEKGLEYISFSADPFHQEYIPLEYVRNAVQAAKKLNMRCEIANSYFLGKDDDSVLEFSREITTRMLPYRVDTYLITFIGTAAEVLAEHAPKQPWMKYNRCKIETQLVHPDVVSIDPYGYVQPLSLSTVCSAISMGNAKERKLSEIIRTYNIEEHPIMKVLRKEGPVGLARMAMNHGFKPTEYADGCHLCYEARKVLLKYYPQYLAPAIWYRKAKTSFRKIHAASTLGKSYQYVDLKGNTLDTLLLAAQDPDENTRRASIFALEDCISNGTKGKIFNLFENLLEDKAKSVKYGALEALTEVLPYKISDKSFDRILEFLQADEPGIRWRVALALNKAYPELDARQREKTLSALTELIKGEDIFVKVRAYEALLNIKDLEKREFPEVDKALKEEEDFVKQWVLYNFEQK